MKGVISSVLDWFEHPANSEVSISAWAAFLVAILILSFLWSTVVSETLEA